jgi:beta-glucanase (GH16 family)
MNTSEKRLALLWSEEFDGPAGSPVNPAHWQHDIGDGTASGIPGWGNQEREYYLESQAFQNGNSCLVIEALRMGETNPYQCYYGKPAEWISSKLTTYNKIGFQFGRLEVRMKAPIGVGTWPAFWMLGERIVEDTWPLCGEIDIFEGKGVEPKMVFGTLHGPGYSGERPHGKVILANHDLSEDFNVFAIEWIENQITWFINGEEFFKATNEDVRPNEWVYNQPFYLITNLAMGGHFTGDIDPDLQSARLEIDWIRYYSVDGVGKLIQH